MPRYCSVPQCGNNNKMKEKYSFYRFPSYEKDPERRAMWAKACQRIDPVTRISFEPATHLKDIYVCSEHFITGEPSRLRDHPDYAPTILTEEQKGRNSKKAANESERKIKRFSRMMNRTIVKRKQLETKTRKIRGKPQIPAAQSCNAGGMVGNARGQHDFPLAQTNSPVAVSSSVMQIRMNSTGSGGVQVPQTIEIVDGVGVRVVQFADGETQTMQSGSDDEASAAVEEELIMRTELYSWLEGNYTPNGDVMLLQEHVYQHYLHHCSHSSIPATMDLETFLTFLEKKYPHLQKRKIGSRVNSCYKYIQGLDILKDSDEYETVIKGRKLDSCQNQIGLNRIQEGRKQKDSKEGHAEANTSIEGEPGKKISHTIRNSKAVHQMWSSQSKDTKELHRKMIYQWFEDSYEPSPQMCLLRTSVYEHYAHFCSENQLITAPQNFFGQWLLKKFPHLSMRRLGCRGGSKYYYMGIDIREDNPFYVEMSQSRVVSTIGKPKTNRVNFQKNCIE